MVKASRDDAAATSPNRSTFPAEQVWVLMQQFVDSHNRHVDLAQALGFRLGAGRGKILFQLRDGAMTLTDLAEANGVDANNIPVGHTINLPVLS